MSELSALQLELARALTHDKALDRDEGWTAFAALHIGGNDRLSPAEQLEIYREQFWLRHTGSLIEDFPGLSGILGQEDWDKLTVGYLSRIKPDSFTLRDLGLRLPAAIEAATWLPHHTLCLDMARLEVAYVEAFDATDRPGLRPERLAEIPPERLAEAHLELAPALRLLRVDYPVADLRRALRTATDEAVAIPEPKAQNLVVYRKDLGLWDQPLTDAAFALLSGLGRDLSLGEAADVASRLPDAAAEIEAKIGGWFQEWTAKGWVTDIRLG